MDVRRQRRGRRSGKSDRRVLKGIVHAEFSGKVLRGRFDPPQCIAAPWNNLTVAYIESISSTPTSTTVGSIAIGLRGQIGLVAAQTIELRFVRLGVWIVDAIGVTNNLAIRADALLRPATSGSHQWIEDTGTTARPAHCHYLWPRSEQNVVFTIPTDNAVAIYQTDTKGASTTFVHLRVLWRPVGGDPIPSFRKLAICGPPSRSDSVSESGASSVVLL